MAKVTKDKKRPLSAYNIFCQNEELRTKIQTEHKDWNSGEVLAELGAMWKKLSDDDKKPYQDLADKSKEEFNEYKKNNPSDNYDYQQVLKRPKSSYMHFSNNKEIREKIRAEHPEWKVTDIASHLGKQWNSMAEKQRKVWEDKAEQEKKDLQDNPIWVTKKKKKLVVKSTSENRLDALEKIVLELQHQLQIQKQEIETLTLKLEG